MICRNLKDPNSEDTFNHKILQHLLKNHLKIEETWIEPAVEVSPEEDYKSSNHQHIKNHWEIENNY